MEASHIRQRFARPVTPAVGGDEQEVLTSVFIARLKARIPEHPAVIQVDEVYEVYVRAGAGRLWLPISAAVGRAVDRAGVTRGPAGHRIEEINGAQVLDDLDAVVHDFPGPVVDNHTSRRFGRRRSVAGRFGARSPARSGARTGFGLRFGGILFFPRSRFIARSSGDI